MREDKAREIAKAKDLRKYTIEECREADRFVREYALQQLRHYLKGNANKIVRDYVMLMATHSYGSAETDKFLSDMQCYPSWIAD